MFLGLIALLSVASVPLIGGRLALLAGLQIRGIWILLPTLVAQVLITDVVTGAPRALLATIHLATYAAAAYVIWLNRTLPGIVILGAGAAMNALAITVNGGTLPASASALRAAGIHEGAGFANSGVLAHPKFGFLGDTMSTPSWLPFRNVISVGDMVILVGVFVLLHAVCASRLGRPLQRLPFRTVSVEPTVSCPEEVTIDRQARPTGAIAASQLYGYATSTKRPLSGRT
jgi:hypothetical protein